MTHGSNAILAPILESVGVHASTTGVRLSGDQQIRILGVQQPVLHERRREFHQVADRRVSAAGRRPPIRQRLGVRSPVPSPSAR